tara:strand:- start:1378 stop:1929 length:552 start_codon:yes stop_codon:yes gene_type:complete
MKILASPVALLFLLLTSPVFCQLGGPNATGMDPQESIVGNAENSDHYKTLLSVMKAADLEDILNNDGPFTVFAPSDLAFKKLSRDKITALFLPENKKELQTLLTYHIVAGNFSASKILKAMCRGKGTASFTTVQGEEILASMVGIDIVLTDSNGNTAKITTADSNQCNGVIHEIDSVFLPGKI